MHASLALVLLLSGSAIAADPPPTFEGACAKLLSCRCAPAANEEACVDRLMGAASSPYAIQHITALTRQSCHDACITGDNVVHGRIGVDISNPEGRDQYPGREVASSQPNSYQRSAQKYPISFHANG